MLWNEICDFDYFGVCGFVDLGWNLVVLVWGFVLMEDGDLVNLGSDLICCVGGFLLFVVFVLGLFLVVSDCGLLVWVFRS